jgi:ankyrin repeat protein
MRDQQRNTPIYYATQNMHIEVLETLIRCGGDVNVRCELGNTALHIALMLGDRIARNGPIISCLIDHGANPRVKNDYGQTPVFFASRDVLRKNGLMGMASMTIKDSEFADHKKLALHPKILAKIREFDDKVLNWKRLENMKAAAL